MVSFKINVIQPKRLFSDRRWREEVSRVLNDKTRVDLKIMFAKTYNGWEDEPYFDSTFRDQTSKLSIEVFTKDRIYALVNAGSPPHPILPRKKGFLSFQNGYRSATRPGTLMSRRKVRSGRFISTNSVSHPGFEARAFDKLIASEYESTFIADINNAFKKAGIF